MTPALLKSLIITPTLAALAEFSVTPGMRSERASLLLRAIAIQESGILARAQRKGGPAMGYWQIESPTANDVLRRWRHGREFWRELNLPTQAAAMPDILMLNDIAACVIARGILWLEPAQLPLRGDENGAYNYYLRTWRPGRPRPKDWHESYAKALG